MANKILAAANVPGYRALAGRVSAASDTLLDLPDGAVHIPAVGGRRIVEALDWDPTAHDDGTVSSMAVGDDIYVYAVPRSSSDHRAELIASKNAAGPDGYADGEYARIAGCHYGKWRAIADAYNASASAQTSIIPNSVWDALHRPTCDPSGMFEVIDGLAWMDIYLASSDGQAWPNTRLVSRYGATPVSGADGYNLYYDYARGLRNAGKRFPFPGEWIMGAYGVPQGATGAGDRVPTGQHSDYGFDAVSCLGMDQPAGNLWQTTDSLHMETAASSWNDVANTGKDGSEDHGQVYGSDTRVMRMGGYWDTSAEAGARASARHTPWGVYSGLGVRGACDSLRTAA